MSDEVGAYGTGKPAVPADEKPSPALVGLEVAPLLEKIIPILDAEPDPLIVQKTIEVLAARYCAHMGNLRHTRIAAEGVAKHIRQMAEQFWHFQQRERLRR